MYGTDKKTWLALSSYTFPFSAGVCADQRPAHALTPLDLIRRTAELGVHGIQFSDNMPLDGLSDGELDAIRRAAAEHGIVLETGMKGMTPHRLRRYIELTARLGAKLLRCITDDADYRPAPKEITATLKEALPQLRDAGVTVGVENHDRLHVWEYADIAEAADDPRVGLVVDSTNSLAMEENMASVLQYMAPWCVSFHAKDYTIRRNNSGMGLAIAGAPFGEGRQKFAPIFETLQENARQDFSTVIESWMDRESTLEATLAKERRWAEQAVAFLRTYAKV